MEITITDSNKLDIFSSIFQNIKLFTTAITLQCDKERMYIQTMDSSKISIVEIIIPAKWFSTYKCDSIISIKLFSTWCSNIISKYFIGNTG